MPITLTAFEASPDRGRGLARDMQVRWALEELGLSYDVRLVSFAEMKQAEHLARQPFGQIPTCEEDGLTLFESGAIVHHLAERHAGLLPEDPAARARAIAWMFAAVSTVEPPIVEWAMARMLERDTPWFAARQPMLEDRVRTRLEQLADRLGAAEWLDGDFTAGDLLMVSVLRRLGRSPLLREQPRLVAYIARGEARPAFQRAFAAQRAVFEGQQSAG
ncbi:glutathione S-transferase family protein [Sphingomonas sp. ABOLE]|uniref:glutathione S-transferase family protein n=1 Tax=Sphingomonas sp. ABOLE TaxID=1985878 RepID=UPI000F7F285A|nr:glutathione S-transferase family protein [Sphingomonas sp. ABOLE]RSV33764.1 glutathione S-transferase family protein [Sphingomonas sp. ABOLE]